MMLASPFSVAKSIDVEGAVTVQDGVIYFKTKDLNNPVKLISGNPIVARTLKTLSTGDHLECSGYMDRRRGRFVVDSVHFVGLKTMLGVWKNKRKRALALNRCPLIFGFNTYPAPKYQ